jgi:hypothetical protein
VGEENPSGRNTNEEPDLGAQRTHLDPTKSRGKNEHSTQNAKINFPLKLKKIHITTEITALPPSFHY